MKITRGKANPHNGQQVASIQDHNDKSWQLRKKPAFCYSSSQWHQRIR